MKLPALAGLAVVALAAATATAALAFENTSWSGNVKCIVQARVQGERVERQVETSEGVALSTTTGTFTMGPISGTGLNGRILKQNNAHYKAERPPFSERRNTRLVNFTAWVKAKILARTGLDVALSTEEMKGTFTQIRDFTMVRVNLKIKWMGTVATGEHAGKVVFGSIAVTGTLPSD